MQAEAVEIAVDGQALRGNLYRPGGETQPLAVLFLHGWTGRPNDWAGEVLARRGYVALAIALRGHGDSDGDIYAVSRQDSLDDAVAAYDFLAGQVPAGTGIVVVGNSYGSYISVLLSRERPVAALSLRVPSAYLDEGFAERQMGQGAAREDVLQWRLTPHDWQGNRAFEALHAFTGPVQILESEHDDRVPHQTVENYKTAVADPAQLEFHFMTGWPHSMGDDPERSRQFQKLLLGWLDTIAAKR